MAVIPDPETVPFQVAMNCIRTAKDQGELLEAIQSKRFKDAVAQLNEGDYQCLLTSYKYYKKRKK